MIAAVVVKIDFDWLPTAVKKNLEFLVILSHVLQSWREFPGPENLEIDSNVSRRNKKVSYLSCIKTRATVIPSQ